MPVVSVTHGDDLDGLTCGALLHRLFDAKVVRANYDDLEKILAKLGEETERLFVTDLNIRDALVPNISRIARFAPVTLIDHHPIDASVRWGLDGMGVEVVHDTRDCASALVYNHYRDRLERDAARITAYAAVSDMFEDGPVASRLLDGMDRKFVHHEALLLSSALAADQSDAFKDRVVADLSAYSYPHRIRGAVEAAVSDLEKIVKIREMVPGRAVVIGSLAHMESTEESTGEIANIVMDTLLVPVGLSWKAQPDGMVNISLRGERRLRHHLGELAARLSKAHGGFGGGHARASGAKIPRSELDAFIAEMAQALNA